MMYVVYRHGWNSANQPSSSSPEKVEVARVEAGSPEAACDLARQRVTVYHNQNLSAEPASEVDAREAEIDRKVRVSE